jgi:hypothetical protein
MTVVAAFSDAGAVETGSLLEGLGAAAGRPASGAGDRRCLIAADAPFLADLVDGMRPGFATVVAAAAEDFVAALARAVAGGGVRDGRRAGPSPEPAVVLHNARSPASADDSAALAKPRGTGGPPLSVFLITLNEADRLGAALESVRGLAAKVVVVDAGSADDTVAVALAHGATVRERPWSGYGAQKRFAKDLCRHDWVLNLDADERLKPELRDEIARRIA